MGIEARIAFALKNGELVHIGDVERGLSCGCVCPCCRKRVVAKKGNRRILHFAHLPGSDCAGEAETVLHMLAKKIIAQLPWILIPEYKYVRSKKIGFGQAVYHEEILAKGGKVRIDSALIETHRSSYRPDIEVLSGGNTLIFEVAVTHRVGTKKKRAIRKDKIPTIELRLEKHHALLDWMKLKALIQSSIETKHWIYHPNEDRATMSFFEKYRSAQRRRAKHRRTVPATNEASRRWRTSTQTMRQGRKAILREHYEWYQRVYGEYPEEDEARRRWPHLYPITKRK